MWSRKHSPLLLQTTSSSPVESYHAVLKKGDSSYGLVGASMIVSSADESYFSRARRVQLEFRTKAVTEVETYPFLAGFPHPVQILLMDEIRAFNRRIENGNGIPDHDSIECYCQFYRRYLIPCQHLFHRDTHGDFIKEEDVLHELSYINIFS